MVTADAVVSAVTDPELPMLTLADLGILRSVTEADGRVVVTITPTYTACPAIETMRYDITRALSLAGYPGAEVRTELAPAWSSDWITPEGRRKLADYGIVPPAAAASLGRRESRAPIACPRCGSTHTECTSEFGSTPCKALHRCRDCLEPFECFKCI